MQPAGLYGRRKMLAEVRRAGLATASPGAVDRAMRTLGLSGVVRAKKVYTTSPNSDAVRAPDLLDRDFTSDRPDRVWVADFVRREALFDRVEVRDHHVPVVVAAG
ncbi:MULTISPECIES: hypothetical protein [unclassified Mycolicibacterium]|uniref:hypothetical protein n=1 Tax=Mycolicibacterium sp. SCSIO 43805 TaxID=3378074 RepID=UPI003AB70753